MPMIGSFEMLQQRLKPGPLSMDDLQGELQMPHDSEIPENPLGGEGPGSEMFGGEMFGGEGMDMGGMDMGLGEGMGNLGAMMNFGHPGMNMPAELEGQSPAYDMMPEPQGPSKEEMAEYVSDYLRQKAKEREMATESFQNRAMEMSQRHFK